MGGARQRRRDEPGPPSRVAAVLAGRAGRGHARPGEALDVRVDRLLLDGPTAAAVLRSAGWTPGAGGAAGKAGAGAPLVRHPARLAVVAGAAQPDDERLALARLARERNFLVSLEPARAGLPGVVGVDEGLVGSDDVVVGTTPDVGALGGLGCVALRCGIAELAGLLDAPELATVVPSTLRVRVSGRLPRWAGGVDLALAVLDALDAAGAAGTTDVASARAAAGATGGAGAPVPAAVLELHGPAIDGLDLPARLALCAALAAAGRAAIVPPDLPTRAWLAARRPVRREAGPAVHAGDAGVAGHAGDAGDGGCTGVAGSADGPAPGARESDDGLDVDAATAAPTALQGGFGGRRHALRSGEATPAVDEAWLGGRLEELREAAEVLRDHSVRRGLRLAVVAASQRTLLHAIEEGLAADMLRAGATLVPPGAAPPPLPAGILRVTNVPGRAHGSDEVLAGPAVVAASAVAGRLVEPETMRRAHRRATRVH